MLTKEKKVRMFLQQDGKCEYCECDMVLCFANKYNNDNLATFDHLYNKDHEFRVSGNKNEKRIFIVCKKCNSEKSKAEPNHQKSNGVEKTVRKLVPKEAWTDEKFMERITQVLSDESETSKGIGLIDKQVRKLNHEKRSLEGRLSKTVRYRNLLLKNMSEPILPNSEQNPETSVATGDDSSKVDG